MALYDITNEWFDCLTHCSTEMRENRVSAYIVNIMTIEHNMIIILLAITPLACLGITGCCLGRFLGGFNGHMWRLYYAISSNFFQSLLEIRNRGCYDCLLLRIRNSSYFNFIVCTNSNNNNIIIIINWHCIARTALGRLGFRCGSFQ